MVQAGFISKENLPCNLPSTLARSARYTFSPSALQRILIVILCAAPATAMFFLKGDLLLSCLGGIFCAVALLATICDIRARIITSELCVICFITAILFAGFAGLVSGIASAIVIALLSHLILSFIGRKTNSQQALLTFVKPNDLQDYSKAYH